MNTSTTQSADTKVSDNLVGSIPALEAPKPIGKPVYQMLAHLVQARLNCIQSGNAEWEARHEENILAICKNELPSGSGIDCGTKIDLDKSTGDKLVLNTAFHHMDENGMYDGWTEHVVTVKPSLQFDIELSISGRDRNQIKEYLYETYQIALTEPCETH